MIAPQFRACNSPDLPQALKKYIEENHGTDLWNACSDGINNAKKIKDELVNAHAFASDTEQMVKLQELFAKDYQYSMLFNKYFSFGSKTDQINCQFKCKDSFSGASVQSFNALFDALGSKYNLGVAYARQGCFMNLEGDGIKHASKAFQQAAWIFDDLSKNVSQLAPSDITPDFTNEGLTCLSNLMLA